MLRSRGRRRGAWAWGLTALSILLTTGLLTEQYQQVVIVLGLLAFAVIFAMNSALHSYGIVALAKEDGVSLDVGFYYMANALGRLLGTVLSGVVFQLYGIVACIAIAVILSAMAAYFVRKVEFH